MIRTSFYFTLLITILANTFTLAYAQTEVDERAMIRFDKGLGFHAPDTSFGLNLRFRIQNRLGFHGLTGSSPAIDEVDARIRRLRLRIDGYTRNDRLTYYMQLSFSRSDQDWDGSGVPHIVRDAMVYYTLSDNFYVGFGQGKLPGNRQRINSSGQLQFADRSDVNAIYNIDRDFGMMGYYSNNISFLHYNLKTAISTGDGRNALPSGNGMAYTARIELMPLGRFIDDGDFSEGDLEREPTPKLSVGAGWHYNQKATKAQGQRGRQLFEERDLRALYLDAVMKYRGWAMYAEYMDRSTDDPLTVSADDEFSHVMAGYGTNFQISHFFHSNIELAGRYTYVNPETIFSHTTGEPQINPSIISAPKTEEYTLGITKYIDRHKIKAQGNIGYRITENLSQAAGTSTGWVIRFQVELGI